VSGESPRDSLASSPGGELGSLRDAWEAEAHNWARFARGHDHWRERFNWPAFAGLLPAPAGPVLDLGCGEGRTARDLRALGHGPLVGVDASPTLVAMARDGGGYDEVIAADAVALPFDDARFALVVAFMTLHDMDDAEGALREAARVLAPGGRLCAALVHPMNSASIVGAYFPQRRYADFHERDAVSLTFHSIHRSLQDVCAAFERAGLLIEALREPVAVDAAVADHPDLARTRERPAFLHLRAR
jgi:SAM-dependent methyltransferase